MKGENYALENELIEKRTEFKKRRNQYDIEKAECN